MVGIVAGPPAVMAALHRRAALERSLRISTRRMRQELRQLIVDNDCTLRGVVSFPGTLSVAIRMGSLRASIAQNERLLGQAAMDDPAWLNDFIAKA